MWFYFKRYRHVVSKNRKLLLLAFVPLAVYLVLASLMADRSLVIQKLRIPHTSPVASAKGPIELISVKDLVSHPEDLFQDQFALAELANRLYAFPELGQGGPAPNVLKVICQRHMSLNKEGDDTLIVSYSGANSALGEEMVGFFSERLLNRAEEGRERTNRQTGRKAATQSAYQPGGVGSPDVPSVQEPPWIGALGAKELFPQHAVWRPERFPVAFMVFVVSVIFMVLFFGFLEWADPSFKSERQVARYLGAPILGSIPNLDKLSQALRTSSPK